MKIAVIGNLSVPVTTESYYCAALENLGHTVDRYQENMTDWRSLAERIEASGAGLVFWTRTPSYGCDPTSQAVFVGECKGRGIVTCGLHLDRYWDLARQVEILAHPWWRQDHIYTADGGNQDRFEAAGIDHRWWRPAVSASQCGRGTKDPRYEDYRAEYGDESWQHRLRRLHPLPPRMALAA